MKQLFPISRVLISAFRGLLASMACLCFSNLAFDSLFSLSCEMRRYIIPKAWADMRASSILSSVGVSLTIRNPFNILITSGPFRMTAKPMILLVVWCSQYSFIAFPILSRLGIGLNLSLRL